MSVSLHHLLLRRLLPIMLLILLAGASIAYWVALRSANQAYDQSLLNTAWAISENIELYDGHPYLQLSEQARTLLLTDKHDRIFFSITTLEGMSLLGDPLPPPSVDHFARLIQQGLALYDGQHTEQPVRIAALRSERDGVPLVILVGETRIKRDAVVRDVIVGILLPGVILLIVTVFMIRLGVHTGLMPLTDLLRQLSGRSQVDLRPIAANVPREMQPLIEEINSLLKRLDTSLSSQRNFVSDAAHQLRTPIATLQTQVELALRQTDPAQQKPLENILITSQRLSHLVSQLLALARAEPSRTEIFPRLTLESIFHEVAETWLPQAIARHIDLGFELSPCTVQGNSLLLVEMLGNLVDNALRHTPTGGTITVSGQRNPDGICLAVEDSGPGMSPAERQNAFERFYQVPGGGSEGCGLGLPIVRAIAEQHGGSASITDPRQLGGLRVEIKLPAAVCGKG